MRLDDRPADREAYTPAHLFSSKERTEDPRRVLDATATVFNRIRIWRSAEPLIRACRYR
jgi:hypothetical protein